MRTGRIIREHSSQFAHVPAGRIGPEHQALAGQVFIQLGQDDSRLHPCPPFLAVDLKNSMEARDVEDDARPDGGTGQIGPRGAGRHGNAARHGVAQQPMDVILGFHQGDGLGLHPVHTGVDRIRGFGRTIVFDLVFPEQLAKIRTDGAGRIGHDKHRAAF